MRTLSGYFWLPVIGAMIFNFIFWEEKFGVNMLIFDVFVVFSTAYLYDFQSDGRIMKWLIGGNVVALTMVVYQNSDTSVIAAWVSLILIVLFAQFRHRSPIYAVGNLVMNGYSFIPAFFSQIKKLGKVGYSSRKFERLIKLATVPVVLAVFFTVLYLSSNAVLADLAERSFGYFDPVIKWSGSLLNFGRIIFLGLGFCIVGTLLLRNLRKHISNTDVNPSDELLRQRSSRYKNWNSDFGKPDILALKNFNSTGLLSLVILNLLLLITNIVDIIYIWFGSRSSISSTLSKDVHEGTNALIFSIVLAITVIMIFFRGNLNFYRNNIWFKRAAYVWIIQNAFLVLSLFARDIYYISNFGLTPRRIGVIYFLIFVLIGLITVFVKISSRRSFYFVFRVNAWAAIVVLIISTFINWDIQIMKYNIANRANVTVDWRFLLTLSDATLPELEKHRQEIKAADGEELNHGQWSHDHTGLIDLLNYREDRFKTSQKKYSWLSWNYSDFITNRRLAVK